MSTQNTIKMLIKIKNIVFLLKKTFSSLLIGAPFKGGFKGGAFMHRDINHILYDLEKCELESGFFGGPNKVKPVFRDPRNQVSICSYFRRITRISVLAQAFIDETYSVKNAFTAIGKTTSRASYAKIGYNKIVATYPEQKVVCKAAQNKHKAALNSLRNEADALCTVKHINAFKAPEFINDQLKSNAGHAPAIWIEFIKENNAIKPISKNIFAIKMLNALFCMYEYQGIEFEIPTDMIEKAPPKEKLLSLGWDKAETDWIIEALEKIANCGMAIPKSYIHGDAHVGNCMIDENGKLIIIDWEYYRWDYIFNDVFSLERQAGTVVTKKFMEWLEKVAPSNKKFLCANLQQQLFNILRYIALNNWFFSIRSTWDKKHADQEIAKIKQKVTSGALMINKKIN